MDLAARERRWAEEGPPPSMPKDQNDLPESAVAREWKPVLGLSDEPIDPSRIPHHGPAVFDQPEPDSLIELTVIVPARNE
jgi:hypothetical protein